MNSFTFQISGIHMKSVFVFDSESFVLGPIGFHCTDKNSDLQKKKVARFETI